MMLPRYAPQIMLMGKLPCIVMFASSVGNAFICSSEPNHGKLHNILNKHFHISYVHIRHVLLLTSLHGCFLCESEVQNMGLNCVHPCKVLHLVTGGRRMLWVWLKRSMGKAKLQFISNVKH